MDDQFKLEQKRISNGNNNKLFTDFLDSQKITNEIDYPNLSKTNPGHVAFSITQQPYIFNPYDNIDAKETKGTFPHQEVELNSNSNKESYSHPELHYYNSNQPKTQNQSDSLYITPLLASDIQQSNQNSHLPNNSVAYTPTTITSPISPQLYNQNNFIHLSLHPINNYQHFDSYNLEKNSENIINNNSSNRNIRPPTIDNDSNYINLVKSVSGFNINKEFQQFSSSIKSIIENSNHDSWIEDKIQLLDVIRLNCLESIQFL